MKRTQIYLPYEMHQKLAREAKKKRITVSELIRLRISRGTQSVARRLWTKSDLFNDIDNISKYLDWNDTPKNLSEKVDKTLYG